MIFSKSNLIIYIPMRSNFNELIAGYTVTNTDVVMSTDVDGTADMAGDFGNNTQARSLSLINDVGVDIANQMNSTTGVSFILNAIVGTNATTQTCHLLACFDGSNSERFNFMWLFGKNSNYYALYAGSTQEVDSAYGTATTVPSTWTQFAFTAKKQSSFDKLDGQVFFGTTTPTLVRSETNQLALTGTSPAFLIGRRTEATANRYFNGKMNNLQIHKKVLTPAEQFFANKFRNKKRVVS